MCFKQLELLTCACFKPLQIWLTLVYLNNIRDYLFMWLHLNLDFKHRLVLLQVPTVLINVLIHSLFGLLLLLFLLYSIFRDSLCLLES